MRRRHLDSWKEFDEADDLHTYRNIDGLIVTIESSLRYAVNVVLFLPLSFFCRSFRQKVQRGRKEGK